MLWIGGIKKAKSNAEPCGLLADPAAADFEYPLRFSYQIHPTKWANQMKKKNIYINIYHIIIYIYIIVLSLNLGFAWGLNNLTWGMFHYFTIHSWESTRIDVSFPGASDANYHLWMRSLGIFRIRSFSIAVWPARRSFSIGSTSWLMEGYSGSVQIFFP